ncbi:MAG TPA: universal stress protein [Pyrinomonadaceae bacterium]|jgi:nucleotide-binding universal stress UspA family protein|nr:universal stress protein [Pyrinomonadaceae bacterium]
MRILIGVDGSPHSDAALEEVAQRPWPTGTEILVLHAFELPMAATPEIWAIPPDYYEQLDRCARDQADSIIKAAVAKLQSVLGNAVEIKSKAVLGSARGVILDEAEVWKPDLIVVGSHGYPAWERLLLGSVSQAVVSHAKCSVEVVRAPKPRQAAAA